MKYRLLLYGLGGVFNKHCSAIRYFEMKGEIEIVGVVSSYVCSYDMLDGYRVFHVKELADLSYDYLVIMGEKSFNDIYQKLISMGVKKDKILSYKVFEFPNLHWEEYIKLKKSNISIISNNCWGGMAYYTLGLECRSPFKNLFIEHSYRE